MKKIVLVILIILGTGILLLTPNHSFQVTVAASNFSELSNTQQKGTRRALLIGIGKYKSDRFPSLEYPANDVARLAELLESPNYNFKVAKLTDETAEKPTRENILKAIRKYLVDEAEEGDTCIFYFSGHGSSIKNSLSDEDDLRDETIIPSDAVRPVTKPEQLKDIRDKELAELFNLAVDKKVKLTAIFDSCHSGSIARGDEQTKEVDSVELDIKTAPSERQKIKPEDRGALIITAAEDYQKASGSFYRLNNQGGQYSHLTANLVSALYQTPANLISSEDLFQKITAQIKAKGKYQTPTISGIPERLEENIFGEKTTASSGKVRVTATKVKDDNNNIKNYLQGGIADGLNEGVELKRINLVTGEETVPPLKVRITKAGLTLSEYEIIGASEKINNGETFEQTTWVTTAEPNLTIWLPAAQLNGDDFKKITSELEKLRADDSLKIVDEPTEETPTNFIYANVKGGTLDWTINFTDGQTESLGKGFSSEAITSSIKKNKVENPKLFVNLPPSTELREAIETALKKDSGRIALATKPTEAQYELMGRIKDNLPEYSWVLRSAFTVENEKVKSALNDNVQIPVVSLPAVTDWQKADKTEAVSINLRNLAFKLGKISGLLKLTSPIDLGSGKFPYHLEIRNSGSNQKLRTNGLLRVGEKYDFVLSASPDALKEANKLLPEFNLYLVSIDSNGKSSIVSQGKYGGEGNLAFDTSKPPTEIVLKKSIMLDSKEKGGSFGTETLILLVIDKPLTSFSALRFSGVRKIEVNEKGNTGDPLQSLLSDMGVQFSAKGESSPDTWLVQQITMRSVEN